MQMKHCLFIFVLFLLATSMAGAQVLGPCGSDASKTASTAPGINADDGAALQVQPIPLPGQKAIDFELTAVVGNDIKNIKLSDYAGKWRVLCFFPAAFTFV